MYAIKLFFKALYAIFFILLWLKAISFFGPVCIQLFSWPWMEVIRFLLALDARIKIFKVKTKDSLKYV